MNFNTVLIVVGVIFLLTTLITALMRYRIANSNQILVVTGKVSGARSAKTIHGGATFIWPLIQNYFYLDLSPMQINIDLKNALSQQNIRISVPSSFTIAIGTQEEVMGAAAERLLGKNQQQISSLAEDIILGQLRSTIATMLIEDINADRETFIEKIFKNVETELKKVGLIVLNVNITDLTDASGYLEALGRKAAAGAIERARIDVAEKTRDGEIGSAEAKREERIKTAEAGALAIIGENVAKQDIASSNADLKVKQEEAKQRETASELVNKANAEKEGYDANTLAENARSIQEKARLTADIIVPAQIEKEKIDLAAQADKIKEVLLGESAGEALSARMEGEAKGILSILNAKADGFKNIIAAAGSAEAAAQLMIIEQLPELTRIQVDAIKNIKIDKITVWETGGNGGGGEGTGSLAGFMQNMLKTIPPLNDLLEQSGLEVPAWMAKRLEESGNTIQMADETSTPADETSSPVDEPSVPADETFENEKQV